jgi:hypothetical protein
MRNNSSLVTFLGIIALAVSLCGCGSGKRPFLIAQVCLRNAEDLSAFTGEMQLIAQSEGKQLIDNSKTTQAELNAAGHPVEGARTKPVINMGIQLGDGVGLTVGNLGLPGYQVAVGFSEGSSPADANRFADAVVKKLAQRWRVESLPGGTGAKGMENCN